MDKTVSIVMCTYNGEKYLSQQIDTLLNQTYPVHEIIIQDDHSTDNTVSIIKDYAAKFPIIKFHYNEKGQGVNNNFFSAFEKASGEYIAICDQDDLWNHDKIERQIEAIGDNLLCVCRSIPFSDDGTEWKVDKRMPNSNPIHFLYYAMPGHCMMLKKELIDKIPNPYKDYRTLYDWIILFTASCLNGVVIYNDILVKQRRHTNAATYIPHDSKRERSYLNGFCILWWSLLNFNKMQPYLRWKFKPRLELLEAISHKSTYMDDAKMILESEGTGLKGIYTLMKFHVKYQNILFFTYSKGIANYFRAALYCFMHLYNYKYLLENKDLRN